MIRATDFGNRDDSGAPAARLAVRRMRPCRARDEWEPGIVREVAGQDAAQVAFAEDENVIETLAPDRADEAFHERIRPGAVRRRKDFVDLHALHSVPERLTVDLVTIATVRVSGPGKGTAASTGA